MIKLVQSISAWATPDFETTLKQEIESIDTDVLPLQAALTQTSQVSEDKFDVVILNVSENNGKICAKTGIFYSGVIAGCACADDPTPLDTITEYCELIFDIDKQSAETRVTLLGKE